MEEAVQAGRTRMPSATHTFCRGDRAATRVEIEKNVGKSHRERKAAPHEEASTPAHRSDSGP